MTQALQMSKGSSSQTIVDKVAQVVSERIGPFLDLGCGKGDLQARLSAYGKTNLTGVDAYDHRDLEGKTSPKGRDNLFRFVKADLTRPLPFEADLFDVVTAVEVLHFLENPRALVREMVRVARSGALIVASVPNLDSWTSLISMTLRGYPSAFGPQNYPAHLTPISEMDLYRMFNEAGLKNLKTVCTNSGRIPGTPWRWPATDSVNLFRGKRFSDNLIVTGEKIQYSYEKKEADGASGKVREPRK